MDRPGLLEILKKHKKSCYLNREIDKVNTLCSAIDENNIDKAKWLIDHGYNIPEVMPGENALVHAVLTGRLEITKLLVENGSSVNSRGRGGDPVLMMATRSGRADIVEFLLKARADVNLTDIFSVAALAHAVFNNDLQITTLLLKAGAKVNYQMPQGLSVLTMAAILNNADIIKLLLKAGADVNLADDLGGTALMYAVKNNKIDAVKLLLGKGASASQQDHFGNSAYKIAEENNNEEILKLLQDNSANQKNILSKILPTAKGSRVAHSFLIHKISALTNNNFSTPMPYIHDSSVDQGRSFLQRTVSFGANLLSTLFPGGSRRG